VASLWGGATSLAADGVVADSTYSAGDSAPVATERWWESFEDPLLNRAVEQALAGNPDLMAAKALGRQARALMSQQRSALFPSVSASASSSWAPTATLGFGFGLDELPGQSTERPDVYSSGRAAVGANWQVDVFGESTLRYRAARRDALAAESDVDGQALQIANLVAQAYLDVITSKKQVAILEAQHQTNMDLLEILEQRYAGADTSALDVLQQRQQVAGSRAQLPNARLMLSTTEQRLAVLLGEMPTTAVAVSETLPELPSTPSVGSPEALERNRPELRGAERRVQAARDRYTAAWLSFLPLVGVNGEVGGQFTDIGDMRTQMFWSIGGSLSVPLFTGGRTMGGLRQARSALDEARARQTSLVLSANSEVEAALAREAAQRDLVDALTEQLAASDLALTTARDQYLSGLTPFLNVQTSLNRRLGAALSLSQGERDLLSARIALHQAIGGQLTRDLRLASPNEVNP